MFCWPWPGSLQASQMRLGKGGWGGEGMINIYWEERLEIGNSIKNRCSWLPTDLGCLFRFYEKKKKLPFCVSLSVSECFFLEPPLANENSCFCYLIDCFIPTMNWSPSLSGQFGETKALQFAADKGCAWNFCQNLLNSVDLWRPEWWTLVPGSLANVWFLETRSSGCCLCSWRLRSEDGSRASLP